MSIRALIAIHLLLNFLLSMSILYISLNNYPGGEALMTVNKAIKSDPDRRGLERNSVYVSNLAAQTGFTRFLQLENVYYNKEPTFDANQFASYQVIYLVLEVDDERLYLDKIVQSSSNQSTHQLAASPNSYECHLHGNITAFDRIDFKERRVNFRTFLNIYKCNKMQANIW